MNKFKKSYQNENWHLFSNFIKKRDNYKCLKCGRNESEVVLQTHHTRYDPGLEPWQYPLSDCITLCKGCHAREHNLVEPTNGWTLVSLDDLGDLIGICERKGCGNEIRYEHIIYHPLWGYKSVGSTCVEYLTQEDRYLSEDILKLFKRISDFVNNIDVDYGRTKNNKSYSFVKFKHHQIRIYGKEGYYSFQIALKEKGVKWYDFKKIIQAKNKTFDQVLELGFIVLNGLISEDEDEIENLRNIYRSIK